jgi:hypothetical protein
MTVGDDLYGNLAPLAGDDASNGFALQIYANALGLLLQEISDIVSDGPNGEPGWSILLDVNRAPLKGLPWLAQAVGVQLPAQAPGQSDAVYDPIARAAIVDLPSEKRGRPATMISEIKRTLTGEKNVILRERNGGAWKLTVVTFAGETPSSTDTLAAILRQKPGGITLTYNTVTGQDYEILFENRATYGVVNSTYLTYNGVLNNAPGT